MKGFGITRFFAVLCAATGCNGSSTVSRPPPTTQPGHAIKHIVILLQENRSFNNLFAGFPGATTALKGPRKPGPRWCKPPYEVTLVARTLAQGPANSGGTDICHSHQCFKIECDFDAQTQ